MTIPPPIRVGTRGSALALTQTGHVAEALRRAAGWDDEALELVRIRTEGDRTTASLAALGGAGVFVAALREAVLDGRCDLAVHSLKDLPTAPAPGLLIAAIPPREDPRDALCARDGRRLADLPEGASVGTGSPRRAAQLLAARPDLRIVDIRGNVGTRLGRVPGLGDGPGDLDAVVLAAAGLARLGLDVATELLDPAVLAPAPGQGALAVECRADDDALVAALAALDDESTRLAVTAERSLLATLEAGCAAPLGALGTVADARLHLSAVVLRPDGGAHLRASASTAAAPRDEVPGTAAHGTAADGEGATGGATVHEDDARDLGAQLAHRLLADGAAELAGLRPSGDRP